MPLTRSQQMSRIRGKDTGPELRLRKALWATGMRYRLHHKTPVGRPDVVFPGKRVAVFVDGGFWHGCPRHYVRPGSRAGFWASKLRDNVARDRRQTLALEDAGWRVVRLWEHEVYDDLEGCVEAVRAALLDTGWSPRSEMRVVRVDVVDAEQRIETRHLEALRDPTRTETHTGRRVTAKWKRPR